MSLKGKSLYILTPMYGGQLAMNYHDSFVQLFAICKDLQIPFSWSNVWNESLISRGRNRLADSFLKVSNHTHAIFIDADIGFNAQDVITMLESDYDIMGVPCTKKSLRWDRIQLAIARRAFEWAAQENTTSGDPAALAAAFRASPSAIPSSAFPNIAGDFVLNFFPFEGEKNFDISKPEAMKHMGTGMLMVKREVFLKFKKCYPDRWYEVRSDPSVIGPIHDFFKVGVNPESREYDSEDYWFCHDCIALGYKVLMLPWVRTTHMGTFTYVGDVPAALAATGEIL